MARSFWTNPRGRAQSQILKITGEKQVEFAGFLQTIAIKRVDAWAPRNNRREQAQNRRDPRHSVRSSHAPHRLRAAEDYRVRNRPNLLE